MGGKQLRKAVPASYVVGGALLLSVDHTQLQKLMGDLREGQSLWLVLKCYCRDTGSFRHALLWDLLVGLCLASLFYSSCPRASVLLLLQSLGAAISRPLGSSGRGNPPHLPR